MKYKAKANPSEPMLGPDSFTLFLETQQILAVDETVVTILTPVGIYNEVALAQEKTNLQVMIDDINEKLAAIAVAKTI